MQYNMLDYTKDNQDRRDMVDIIKQLILKRKDSFSNAITLSDQKEIVGHLMGCLEDPFEWMVESNSRDKTLSTIRSALLKPSTDSYMETLSTLFYQAIDYFSQPLDKLWDDLSQEVKEDLRNDYDNYYER